MGGKQAQLEAALAAAELTVTGPEATTAGDPSYPASLYTSLPGTLDDYQSARGLLKYWKNAVAYWSAYHIISKTVGSHYVGHGSRRHKVPTVKKYRQKDFTKLTEARQAQKSYVDYIAGLFTPISVDTSGQVTTGDSSALLAALREQNASLAGQLLVSQQQYPVFAQFLGSYGKGGLVPGPVGKPGLIVAHGGERVLEAGATLEPRIEVNIHGDQELPHLIDRIEIVVDNKLATQARRAGLARQTPSAPGRRASVGAPRRRNALGRR